MKIALAQFNPTVGDIAGNARKMAAMIDRAAEAGADLVAFGELSLLGYPPKDLLLKPQVIHDNLAALHELAGHCTRIAALVGYAGPNEEAVGRPLRNWVALLADGRIAAQYAKQLLPTYDVFDETRYFEPGEAVQVAEIAGHRVGLTICEDLWNLPGLPDGQRQLYHENPVAQLAEAGAELMINVSASPFVVGKHAFRRELFAAQARQHKLPILYVNQVGGNDELIFDGCSCAFDAGGELIAQAKDFEEDLLVVELWGRGPGAGGRGEKPTTSPLVHRPPTPDPQLPIFPVREGVASLHGALVLGLRDYCRKCGFGDVLIGLSGGVDSAVTAAVAVDALGASHVHGVSMPSRFNAGESLTDARKLAENLGMTFQVVPIESIHKAYETTMSPVFEAVRPGEPAGVAEENVQARIRGNILMALSNKCGYMVLSTGNKSELAVGYCTLYGDMSGGLAVISDVPKTMIYKLAHWFNRDREIIPDNTLRRAPSAELRPDQTDQDTLPEYDVLDAILERYIERCQSRFDIVAAGFDEAVVNDVIRMVDTNEYKRKQAAPGLKVTGRAFGFGRRMPIAQRYRPLGKGPIL
ncbi:MAG: NAD+ synthase [Phycisphaerae bacterium]|nr:NAD+ synthase [Phycisphaerae bacterium]